MIKPTDTEKSEKKKINKLNAYTTGKNKSQQGHELILPPVASFFAILLNPTI